jgi:hypothetical protein
VWTKIKCIKITLIYFITQKICYRPLECSLPKQVSAEHIFNTAGLRYKEKFLEINNSNTVHCVICEYKTKYTMYYYK